MLDRLLDWIQISLNLFNQSSDRIVWNLFLAFIPLTLSFYLFRLSARRNLVWGIILLIFIAFLPNAPYILTDSIHVIELSQNYPNWAIALVLIPQYSLFIVAGFEAYIIALTKLEEYLAHWFARKYLILTQAISHSLCVIGIYIGRFERFNSWDFVTQPEKVLLTTVRDLFDPWKLFSMAIAFLVIWLLAEFVKLVNAQIRLTFKFKVGIDR